MDVRPELESASGDVRLLNFRCCRNAADHLRGSVFVQFKDNDVNGALVVARSFSGRWYAGKQITTRLAYLGGGWKSAVCGKFYSTFKWCFS